MSINIKRDYAEGDILQLNGEAIMSDGIGYFHRMVGAKKARGKVLDIGLGMANFSDQADKNNQVTDIEAVELSQEVIDWVKNNRTFTKQIKYTQKSIEDFILTPANKKFDFIFLDYLWGNNLMIDEAILKTKDIIVWAKDNLKPNGQMVLWQEEDRWYRESRIELLKYFNPTTSQEYWNPRGKKGYWDLEVWTLK